MCKTTLEHREALPQSAIFEFTQKSGVFSHNIHYEAGRTVTSARLERPKSWPGESKTLGRRQQVRFRRGKFEHEQEDDDRDGVVGRTRSGMGRLGYGSLSDPRQRLPRSIHDTSANLIATTAPIASGTTAMGTFNLNTSVNTPDVPNNTRARARVRPRAQKTGTDPSLKPRSKSQDSSMELALLVLTSTKLGSNCRSTPTRSRSPLSVVADTEYFVRCTSNMCSPVGPRCGKEQ
jgi:hypothetical protein